MVLHSCCWPAMSDPLGQVAYTRDTKYLHILFSNRALQTYGSTALDACYRPCNCLILPARRRGVDFQVHTLKNLDLLCLQA